MGIEVWLYIIGGAVGEDALTNLGASCYLLAIRIGKEWFFYMIDAGMESLAGPGISWRGPLDLEKLPVILNGKKIRHILVTHGHRDHSAALALRAIRENLDPNANVICTQPTAEFIRHQLYDQRKMSLGKKEELPYDKPEIEDVLDRIFPVERPQLLELAPGKIWVLLWPGGHIRGSCSMIFVVQKGKTRHVFMFSGDYACHDQLTTLGAPLPPKIYRPYNILSIDSTNCGEDLANGTNEKTFWQREVKRMAEDGKRAVKSGNWFLTFAFALDRCPTFARKLADLGLHVYLDGFSARNLWDIMESKHGFWCNQDRSVNAFGKEIEIMDEVGGALDKDRGAIVVPSGMGHGPAAKYLREILPQEHAVVGASGYVAPGTNGYKILHAKRGEKIQLEVSRMVEIFGKRKFIDEIVEVEVNAECKQYRATGHSLRKTIVKRVEELLARSPAKNPMLGLCHGSTPALDWIESQLSGKFRTFRQDKPEDRRIQLL